MKESLGKALASCFHIYLQYPDCEILLRAFGFECGSGWGFLLIEFAQAAENLDLLDVQIARSSLN